MCSARRPRATARQSSSGAASETGRAPSLESVYQDFTRPACAALTRHGVQRVVTVSAPGRGVPGDAGLVTAAPEMCDLITATGVAHRALTGGAGQRRAADA